MGNWLAGAGRVLVLALTLVPFLPAYLLGACWEAARAGWRAGRRDVSDDDAGG